MPSINQGVFKDLAEISRGFGRVYERKRIQERGLGIDKVFLIQEINLTWFEKGVNNPIRAYVGLSDENHPDLGLWATLNRLGPGWHLLSYLHADGRITLIDPASLPEDMRGLLKPVMDLRIRITRKRQELSRRALVAQIATTRTSPLQ